MPPPQAAPRPPTGPAPPAAPAPPSAPLPPGEHDAKRARMDFVLQAEEEFLEAHPGHSKVGDHESRTLPNALAHITSALTVPFKCNPYHVLSRCTGLWPVVGDEKARGHFKKTREAGEVSCAVSADWGMPS